MFRPKSLTSPYYQWYWDNFRFVILKMFLYAVGFLLKHERFDLVFGLMSRGYYVGNVLDNPREPMQRFDIIYQPTESLGRRNQRLNFRRLSLRADMLEKRSHASGLLFEGLMQADFVLYFFNSITAFGEKRDQRWWPGHAYILSRVCATI